MLESEQAARRLGVKVSTLYAYVSRGLIESHPSGDGRRSLFDAEDVEALARRARGSRSPEPKAATVLTRVTHIGDDGPAYRGRRVADLAESATYEQVAELLWRSTAEPTTSPWEGLPLDPPPTLGVPDRLTWIVLMAGARDPRRGDVRAEAVVGAARRLIVTMAGALGTTGDTVPTLRIGTARIERSVAGVAAAALIARPRPAHVAAVNTALVLLADHELAASTLAVRVAASTRADLYEALLAGLGAMAGPFHSGAPVVAEAFLREAERLGADRAVDDVLRRQARLPGFGHPVYRAGDPRFQVLRRVLDAAAPARWRALLASVLDAAASRGAPEPNVDLALGAMSLALDMAPGAGRYLFTIARVAGWVAHYLEELGEPPLRFRTRAIYAAR